ncbi:hypothetical protein VKS41_006327 [Umbelopsis sp. WA50703]
MDVDDKLAHVMRGLKENTIIQVASQGSRAYHGELYTSWVLSQISLATSCIYSEQHWLRFNKINEPNWYRSRLHRIKHRAYPIRPTKPNSLTLNHKEVQKNRTKWKRNFHRDPDLVATYDNRFQQYTAEYRLSPITGSSQMLTYFTQEYV